MSPLLRTAVKWSSEVFLISHCGTHQKYRFGSKLVITTISDTFSSAVLRIINDGESFSDARNVGRDFVTFKLKPCPVWCIRADNPCVSQLPAA